jgi:hypothetical protein
MTANLAVPSRSGWKLDFIGARVTLLAADQLEGRAAAGCGGTMPKAFDSTPQYQNVQGRDCRSHSVTGTVESGLVWTFNTTPLSNRHDNPKMTSGDYSGECTRIRFT